jgi:hypothetical protein
MDNYLDLLPSEIYKIVIKYKNFQETQDLYEGAIKLQKDYYSYWLGHAITFPDVLGELCFVTVPIRESIYDTETSLIRIKNIKSKARDVDWFRGITEFLSNEGLEELRIWSYETNKDL